MQHQPLKRDDFRFWLRPIAAEDGEAIYPAADESRERVGAWMDWLTPSYTVDDSITWAREMAEAGARGIAYEYVMVDGRDGEVTGCCGLNRLNEKDLVCNLGYWVRDSKVRQGAAVQATLLLKAFGLETLGLQRLEIVVAVGNTASQKVAVKAGAVYEGVQHLRLKIGEHSHDAHMYALTRDDIPGRSGHSARNA